MIAVGNADADIETRSLKLPWAAVTFLLLTAVVSLLWSHHKLLSQDEFFVLQTDSVSSLAQLVHIQRTSPISLDPLVYHVLAHTAIRIFGAGAFALRLPSLIGYLTMQFCLFVFVRRIASQHAALFALAFPALTATLFYSAEGRPYGLLLGFYGITMIAWQAATRRDSQRAFSLIGLALAVALTLNTHYYGILLLVPLCAAELIRTLQRKRLDLPVVAAIFIGMAGIVFALPFEKAAGEFRTHYYNAGSVDLHAISQAYRALFVDYTHATMGVQHAAAIALVTFVIVFLWACSRALRNPDLHLPTAEAAFLIVLAALPFFGFLLARFVTHTIEVRYVLGAIIAVSALLAVVIEPWLRRRQVAAGILAFLFLAIVAASLLRIHAEQRKTAGILAGLTLTPQLKAAIMASPSQRLFVQDMGTFDISSYYEPDPDVRSRITLVYSREQELRWDLHDTASLTAMHMRSFTGFPIVPYETLAAEPGEHIFVLIHSGWNWTDEAFGTAHAAVTPLGTALGGDAASVRFQQK